MKTRQFLLSLLSVVVRWQLPLSTEYPGITFQINTCTQIFIPGSALGKAQPRQWSSEHLECLAALGLHFTWQQRATSEAADLHGHVSLTLDSPPWRWPSRHLSVGLCTCEVQARGNFSVLHFQAVRDTMNRYTSKL